jgi:GT2 family glycosyltransferase
MTASALDKTSVFGRPGVVLQIQSILFNNEFEALERAVFALARACELAIASGAISKAVLRFGDCSPFQAIDASKLERLQHAGRTGGAVTYRWFEGENLGSARGHNRLAEEAIEGTDFLWIQNPDVIVSPRLFEQVLAPFLQPGVGQVEAKQLPIEHPKEYNPHTGETDWTTTACVMTPLALFRALGGFDADSFFLYCDDVDLAFRIRELGMRLIFQPAAVCFHDKRLGEAGQWQPSTAEMIYSAEAALMMAQKWSQPQFLEQTLKYFASSTEPHFQRAAEVFIERRDAGTLPTPRDPKHKVAKFHGHFYTKHRFDL